MSEKGMLKCKMHDLNIQYFLVIRTLWVASVEYSIRTPVLIEGIYMRYA